MTAAEVIILIAGAILFTVSFFIPDKHKDGENFDGAESEAARDMLKAAVEEEISRAKSSLEDSAAERINESRDKIERHMDRITNEKMMAVGEYSDTVLEQIHKDHQEAVFLYDMIDSKYKQVKTTIAEVNQIEKSVKALAEKTESAGRDIETAMVQLVSEKEAVLAIGEDIAAERESAFSLREDIDKEKKALATLFADTERLKADLSVLQSKEAVLHSDDSKKNTDKKSSKSAVKDTGEKRLNKREPKPAEKVIADRTDKKSGNIADKPDSFTGRSDFVSLADVIEKVEIPDMIPTGKNREAQALDSGIEMMFAPEGGSINNNERILTLHKAGKSNMAIAKELGLGVGEVKLVIDLFKNY